MINDLCRVLKIPTHTFDLLRGESDSLAGLILEIAGEFPAIDQQFETNNYVFTVLEINKNRIAKVKVSLKQKQGK
jgi:CBS domain containing-hemolysin-like protein